TVQTLGTAKLASFRESRQRREASELQPPSVLQSRTTSTGLQSATGRQLDDNWRDYGRDSGRGTQVIPGAPRQASNGQHQGNSNGNNDGNGQHQG
ncbi:unnamed protein product, partial [Polarella glacialis]